MRQVRGETMSGLIDRSGSRLVPPVLSVVGCSGSGKTRLITALIPLLAKEGLRVGALKNAYSSFEVDRPGKDSWSMREAGAASVVLASSDAVALMETTPTPWSLEDLVGLFAGRVDVVLAEGHGTPGWAVVEVWRSECSAAPMLPPQNVLALVTDDEVLEPCRRISPDRPAELASLVLASIGFGVAKPEFRETASKKMVQKTSGFLEGLRRISSL